jgi:hypothetical protein
VLEGGAVLVALAADALTWGGGLGAARAGVRALGFAIEGGYRAAAAYTRGMIVGLRLSGSASGRLMAEGRGLLTLVVPSAADATLTTARIANSTANPAAGGAEMLLDLLLFTPSAIRSFVACMGN